MSARYLAALDYTDTHAKMVLQKHRKKRPLGDIEDKHRYTPPQPVLSCRTVNIDVSGTRTYRARSNTDIIAEQHRLIHNVYRKARAAVSAPTRRTQSQASHEHGGVSALKSLKIHGRSSSAGGQASESEYPTAASPSPRDSTSPPRVISPRAGACNRPFVLRRPKTTGSLKKVKPVTDTFLKIRVDPAISESNQLYRECSDKVREQWEAENHNLEEGKFVRGKKRENSAKLDQSGQWLTFGGGLRAKSAGVVDAFTSMKGDSDCYTIEGTVGGDVARQLRRGDKIRIGINGIVQSHDLKIKKWSRDQRRNSTEQESKMEEAHSTFVPLCWNDQLTRPDSNVIRIKGPKQHEAKPNLCDTYPVVFTKQDEEQDHQKQGKIQSTKTNGFKVKSRVKPRKWAGGMDSYSSITSLSIEHRSQEEEMELDRITSEDILKTLHVNDSARSSNSLTEAEKQAVKQIDSLTDDINDTDDNSSLKEEPPVVTSRPESVTSDLSSDTASKSKINNNHSRPVTAAYSVTPDPEMVTSNLLIYSGRKDSPQTPERVMTPRSSTATRPTTVRPLHKAIPSVASISSNGRGDLNLGYIQLTQPVYIPREQQMKGDSQQILGATSAAIQHISDHNKPQLISQSATIITADHSTEAKLNERNRKLSESSVQNSTSSQVQIASGSNVPSHAVTPAPSRAETPELHYHVVDIPTGETFPESGRNSAVDGTLKVEDEEGAES